MLDGRKQRAIRNAYQKAGKIETPYMRLCADIPVKHDVGAGEVSRYAKERDTKGMYRIGHYAFSLLPVVESYFSDLKVPYSFVEVDGLKFNRDVNLVLWLTRPDISSMPHDELGKVLSNISLVEVFNGLASFKELEGHVPEREMTIWKSVYDKLGGRMPFLKPVFQESFGPSTEPNGPYRYRGFFIADPQVLEFYGGEPAPKWYREFVAKARDTGKIKITVIDGEPKIL